ESFEELPEDLRSEIATNLAESDSSGIADCLLAPTENLCNAFEIVTSKLGWVYGEHAALKGVPFVRPLSQFGGTACAQACAFMTMASLTGREDDPVGDSPLCAGVHGLAEITAIITGENEAFLRLAGVRGESLLRYFTEIGRSAFQFNLKHRDPEECRKKLF